MLDALLGFVSGMFDNINQQNTDRMNYNLGMKNYELNKDNLDWQKDQYVNQQGREDNAIQRRVNDLRSAGLSPTLAAGSPASAAGAPSLGRLEAPQAQYSKMDIAAKLAGATALMQQQREISRTVADTKLKELQQKNVQVVTDRENEKLRQDKLSTEVQSHDWNIIKRQGIRSDSNGLAGQLSNLDAFTGGAASAVRDAGLPMMDKAADALQRVIRDSPLNSKEVSVPVDIIKSILDPWGQLNKKTEAYKKLPNNSSRGRSK